MLKIHSSTVNKIISTGAIITIIFMILFGLYTCVCSVKPFWLDEWSIIYNLKFKNGKELWGELAFTQQFPRVYLQIIKWFTAHWGYSYTSLRLPSYGVHSIGLLLCFLLGKRIWKNAPPQAVLWFLIYAAFNTSLSYYVQIKQYTMEMLLGLVSIWLLMKLYEKQSGDSGTGGKLLLICIISLVAPFFSYTYPITLAPLYMALFIQYYQSIKAGRPAFMSWTIISLLLSMLSVGVFYLIHVRQVLQDQGMKAYWADLIMSNGFNYRAFAYNFYMLFADLGSGDLFQVIFFTLSISGLVYCIVSLLQKRMQPYNIKEMLIAYSVLLIVVCMGLNIAGKLPIGTHRLNAFMVPAMASVIVYLLNGFTASVRVWQKTTARLFLYLLIVVSMVNVYASMIGDTMGAEHAKKLSVYKMMDQQIKLAAANNKAICVDSSVAYPFDKVTGGDWVIKVQPAYNATLALPVYQKAANDAKGCTNSVIISAAGIRD